MSAHITYGPGGYQPGVPNAPGVPEHVPPCNIVEYVEEAAVPQSVPPSVPLWRLRAVFDLSGLTPAIVAGIDAMPEPERTVARAAWQGAYPIERASGLVSMLAHVLGMDDGDVDALFRQADALPV